MARMRTIKPEFWTDSTIVQLSPFARLLYIGMWNFAMCDEGHLEDDPIRLKLQVLPMDNIEIRTLLDELLECSRIVRFEAEDGKKYFAIPTLKAQQKGDPRWTPRCPACKDAENTSTKLTQTQESSGETQRATSELKKVSAVEERRVEESRKDLSTSKLEDEFSQWYSGYPKKEAKKAARAAFTKARKTASLEELTKGRDNYIAATRGKDHQFIALPGSWLNAGRWEDDYGNQPTDGPTVPSQYRMFNS